MRKTGMSKYLGHEPTEVHVWHGTSGLDPATIYEDKQVPFQRITQQLQRSQVTSGDTTNMLA